MPHDADAEFIGFQAALAGGYSLDREPGRGDVGDTPVTGVPATRG
jgi:hypothetical protein